MVVVEMTGLLARGSFLSRITRACPRHNSSRLLKPGGRERWPSSSSSRSYYLYSPEPFHPIIGKEPKWMEADDAVEVVTSGMRVFIHGCAATPHMLLDALSDHGLNAKLRDVELLHIHTEGSPRYLEPEYDGIFRSNSLFTGGNCRKAVAEGRADFTPIFLSEIPLLFRRKIVQLDVALIQVSPPDNHGFCSLGPSVDCARAAIQNARHIIAQVNPNMPRTFGDGIIHMSHCDAMVQCNKPLPETTPGDPSPNEMKIGQLIADALVVDGATLQMGMGSHFGIGSIPDAVLCKLTDHRDLGIHSEMYSDGIIPLVNCGAITNAKKVIQTGKIVGSFAFGTQKLYHFMNNNPFIMMLDSSYVNNTAIICQNPKMTAINSCIEVDLTGQVVSDSIGARIYSGVGGQVDFIRGASLGIDGQGKPILAMQSCTRKGESKIVPFLKEGGGVVTTRAHVHYLVTEWGIAYLFGKNLRQRAYDLIRISHPDHREMLEKAAFSRLKCMPQP